MAAVSQNANLAARRALSPKMVVGDEAKHIAPEYIALIAGSVVAAAFIALGLLDWTGSLSLYVRPGEGPGFDGLNPVVDFLVLALMALLGPYGFVMAAKLRRVAAIEDRLPDFLRDVAEAGRFGMTLPDAIVVASRGRYGLLTGEIKKMASQLEWGVPVATALKLFEERVPTPLVKRVVSIITRANEAGGNVADVLTMVAHDTREVQFAAKERQTSMLTYVTVIYISFFVFLVTIYIMAAVFLPQMINAGKGIASSSLAGGGAISLNFGYAPELFLAFMVAVIVHAVGDGVMAGVLYNGKIAEGMQHATIMLAAGWAFMRYAVPNFT
jgi:flagellar protein FlaJ